MDKKTAKRNLSKVEKFYIEQNCSNSTLEEISKDIGCPQNIASSYYKECVDKAEKGDTIDKLMNVNTKSGFAVMTKEASEKGDATKTRKNQKAAEHIHKIRQDK